MAMEYDGSRKLPCVDNESATPSTLSASSHAPDQQKLLATAYRKIDWNIVPLLFLCYFLQFLDKVLVNYGNIMGLAEDLKLQGNDFSWMATSFFIGYAVAEFPQGYLIQRFPVNRVLGWNVVLWGVVVMCTAAVQNFVQITALRTLLGMLEAVIAPALIMITAQWYTRRQATPRTGLWYCGLGAGQFLGGLISWCAQHGPRGGFGGWRIMFVCVGVFNLLVGLAVVFWIPSGLPDARQRGLLTAEEARGVEAALIFDQGGGVGEKKIFRAKGVCEALSDWQVWLLIVNTILIVIPSGIITTFSATIISSFGYHPKQAALLNMPSGVVSILATLASTLAIRHHFPRWLAICLLLVPTVIGAGLLCFHNRSKASALTGIYLINFDVAPLALIYALVGANTQGYTKRVTASSAIAVAFSIANIIGPLTFQAKDSPEYLPARVTVFVVCGASIVVTIGLRLLYGARNRRTAAAREQTGELGSGSSSSGGGGGDSSAVEVRDMTDRENPVFRYVY